MTGFYRGGFGGIPNLNTKKKHLVMNIAVSASNSVKWAGDNTLSLIF